MKVRNDNMKEDMEKHIDRILDKLDKLDDKVNEIDKTLARNTDSLELHMKRTDLLEKHLEKQDERIKPLIQHVDRVNFVFHIGKYIGVGTVVSGIIYVVKTIIGA